MMQTVTPKITIAANTSADIGESPIWSSTHQRLMWIDITGGNLYTHDPAFGQTGTLNIPNIIGLLAKDPAGTLTLGLGSDLARLTSDGEIRHVARAPHTKPGFRFNDGKYDLQGRLWTSLINTEGCKGSGILYRYDPDGTWHVFDTGFDLPNGLEWSHDGQTFYFTDSHKGEIYAYDFDKTSGDIRNRRLFFRIDTAIGKPDGLTIDHEGFFLSVLFDGGAILRIDPEGKIERKIKLPVPRPTCCAFAGDNRHLFVTTARIGLSDADLQIAPASGTLLRLDYQEALQ